LVHVFKKESDFQLPSAVLKNATLYFRGKPARPLEYVYEAKLTERIPPEFVDGLGCTRRCESELESIACSPLQIRHRQAHVPRSTLSGFGDYGERNGPPVSALQRPTNSLPRSFSEASWQGATAAARQLHP
jgi:hypothetical protein